MEGCEAFERAPALSTAFNTRHLLVDWPVPREARNILTKFVMFDFTNPHNNKPVLVNSDHVRTASESAPNSARWSWMVAPFNHRGEP